MLTQSNQNQQPRVRKYDLAFSVCGFVLSRAD